MKLLHYSFFIVIFFYGLLFNSCKNDVKLNAPYKEVPTIYAILNAQDVTQTIRINKVFLGEGDANVMAKVQDSVNYKAGELSITLTYSNTNGYKDWASTDHTDSTITFTEESIIETDPGAFNTNQRVYKTSRRLHTSGTYKITVKNNTTGNVFTASTTALDSISGDQGAIPITHPFATISLAHQYTESGANSQAYIDYGTNPAILQHIKYAPKDGTGAIYQVVVRMHFYDLLLSGTQEFNFVDYVLATQYPRDASSFGGQMFIDANFKGNDLFAGIGSALSKMNLRTDISGRKMYKIEYIIYSSTDDYIDFLQFNSPSLAISQNKPLYSNFDNQAALGIFTFRSRCSVVKEIANGFISQFQSNVNTCQYQFFNADDSRKGCGN